MLSRWPSGSPTWSPGSWRLPPPAESGRYPTGLRRAPDRAFDTSCACSIPAGTSPRAKYRLIRFTRGGRRRVASAALVGDRRDGVLGGLGIEVAATGLHRGEVLVQFVHQRDAGGHVQAGDRGVVDTVEVLDDGAQRVAVRGQQDDLAGLQVRDDLFLPVRQCPLQHVLEAFGVRDGFTGIPGVSVLGVLAAGLDRRRRHIVGAPPSHELLLAELVADLLLVL